MNNRDELIQYYFSLGLNYSEILLHLARRNIFISKRTLKRCLRTLNLSRRKGYSQLEDIFAFLRIQLSKSGQLHGYKWMHLKCLQAGLVVSQEAVRLSLNILDEEGVALRRKRKLRRRQYYSRGPNILWHVDSYDKLKPYGICISGCIDGFSRNIIWLKAAYTNSDPAVIGGYFMEAVNYLGGCPKILRADMGTENRYIEQFQMYFGEFNDFDRVRFIYGKSTGNQRIESWWSILRQHSAQFWMNLFEALKNEGYYSGDFLDKSLLQFVFMGTIQHELDVIAFEWNTHRITKKRNSVVPSGRPITMFQLPECYGTRDFLSPVEDENIRNCREECKLIEFPCDRDIYDLCKIILEENNIIISNDPYELTNVYMRLRNEIRRLL